MSATKQGGSEHQWPREPLKGRLIVRAASASDRGKVRVSNEDAVTIEDARSPAAQARGILGVVADGMGGHDSGEVASRLAVDIVRAAYYRSPSTFSDEALRTAIEIANAEIWREAHRDQINMGCTLTAVVIHGDDLVVGHVGDSRAHLIRQGLIRQVTRDHSWVTEQVAEGALTADEARAHPNRNVITRALGPAPTVKVDMYREKVRAGDIIVVCTDGLTSTLAEDEIRQYADQPEPGEAARALVGLANQRGAPDNVTVAVLRVDHASRARPGLSILKRWSISILLGALIIIGTILILSPRLSERPAESTVVTPTITVDATVLATPVAGTPGPEGPD